MIAGAHSPAFGGSFFGGTLASASMSVTACRSRKTTVNKALRNAFSQLSYSSMTVIMRATMCSWWNGNCEKPSHTWLRSTKDLINKYKRLQCHVGLYILLNTGATLFSFRWLAIYTECFGGDFFFFPLVSWSFTTNDTNITGPAQTNTCHWSTLEARCWNTEKDANKERLRVRWCKSYGAYRCISLMPIAEWYRNSLAKSVSALSLES